MVGGKRKSAELFRKSKRVQESKISRGFRKQHKECGTSERILGCLTVRASWNSIFM